MAITHDIVFVSPQVKWANGDITLDYGNTTPGIYKGALWTASVTPNASQTDPTYGVSPWNAGEATGPGYTAGGLDLTVVSFAELAGSPGKTGWIIEPLLWTETTLEAAGMLVYRASDELALLFRGFGKIYPTADGDFAVGIPTDGVQRRAYTLPVPIL